MIAAIGAIKIHARNKIPVVRAVRPVRPPASTPDADSTKVVLADFNKPTITITMPKINGYYMGQLLYMLEVQIAIAGSLYNIDAFNQPDVEQAQNYTYALMGRVGYEESAHILHDKMTLTNA